MNKMNPEIKTEWVNRLRELDAEGGRQCSGVLRNNHDQMCCLGVLTEIAVEKGVIEPGVLTGRGRHYVYDPDENSGEEGWFGVMPSSVAVWAGLGKYDQNPTVNGGESLASLNDDGVPFSQIAAIIEESL